MKIMTVRPPWASAIVYEAIDPRDGSKHLKDVENRSRNIAGDYRGPVAIHAALAWDDAAFRAPGTSPLGRWWDWETSPAMELTRGHIIGVVDLVDVHLGSRRSEWCWHDDRGMKDRCSPWGDDDAFHLVLANPRPLADPIPYRGALGLRTLDDDTTARILAQIGA